MIYYDGSHSIQLIKESTSTFKSSGKMNGKNTWKDWGLVPSTRPVVNPPAVKTNYIDVPGANGSIDASTVLTSYPVYNNRGMSQEFYIDHDKKWPEDPYPNGREKKWHELYTEIMEYCHGQRMKVILLDDRGYYYLGRVGVNAWKSEKDWSKITLDFNVDPYKYYMFDSTEPWLWDPFSFIDGVIMNPTIYAGANGQGVLVQRTNPRYRTTTYKDKDGTHSISFDHSFEITALSMPVVCTLIVTPNEAVSSDSWVRIVRMKNFGSENASIRVDKKYYFAEKATKTIRMYDIKFINETDIIWIEVGPGKTFNITMRYRNGRL